MYGQIIRTSRQQSGREFSIPEWLRTVICTCFRRPLVFVLFMCVTGAYLGYYASLIIWITVSVVPGLVFIIFADSELLKSRDILTIIAGCMGFLLFLTCFSFYCRRVNDLTVTASYHGDARIISVNAADSGVKNVVLRLENGEKVTYLTDQVYDYGDTLLLDGELSPIYTKGNPGDFDVRAYYLRKGIVRKIEKVKVLERSRGRTLVCYGYRLGSLIRREFYNIWLTATDEQTASLLSAMIVGDDSHLTKDVKSAFKESNLSHILVVSGAHVGYFSATVGILCSVFFKGKKRFVLISVFLILFGFVTGWGDSAFRSILTYIVVGLISFDSRCVDHVSACALSGIILMCLDPFSVFSYGLLLSFGATFSIMLFQRRAGKLVRKWFPILPDEVRTAVSALICAHLGMIPVLAIMGSLISPLSVLVVIIAGFPAEVICSLGMILTVICLFVPFRMICTILFFPVRGLVSILKVLADIGSMDAPGRIRISHVPEAGLIAFSCVILCILVRCGFKRRILAVSAVTAFGTMLVGGWIDPDKISRIYFLDVGQGDCALVCHHGMNILIDGGNQGNGKTIGNVMDYMNIGSVDIAFISHLDSDHIAGILELWNEGRIKHLYASFWSDSDEMRQLKTVFPDLPSEVGILSQGSIVKVDDDLSFEIIWPKDPVDGGNDDSMVVLCRLYGTKVLFTGDISETVEKALPADELEDISVLKVSHHGSRFSTSGPFLCDKKIGAALISVGYNHYGHPSSEVLKRLRANRIPYYRTDERGCVLLSVTETSWQMDYYFET